MFISRINIDLNTSYDYYSHMHGKAIKKYSILHVRINSHKTFKLLKHRLNVDSDLDAFDKMLKIVQEQINGINLEELKNSDEVAG